MFNKEMLNKPHSDGSLQGVSAFEFHILGKLLVIKGGFFNLLSGCTT